MLTLSEAQERVQLVELASVGVDDGGNAGGDDGGMSPLSDKLGEAILLAIFSLPEFDGRSTLLSLLLWGWEIRKPGTDTPRLQRDQDLLLPW